MVNGYIPMFTSQLPLCILGKLIGSIAGPLNPKMHVASSIKSKDARGVSGVFSGDS